MTPEDIKKLPTPETDQNRFDRNEGIAHSLPVYCVDETVCRSLEQRLAAAMMLIAGQHCNRYSGMTVQNCSEVKEKYKRATCERCETLASIRSMK